MDRRRALQFLALASGAGGAAAFAAIDQVRLYAGYPPGTAIDTIARLLAERLRGAYAPTVVVDNKTGASGQLALMATKAARPDGTTVLVSSISTLSVVPHTFSKVGYDPFRDLIPVGNCAKNDFAMAIGPGVPPEVDDLPKFLAWCKANPAKATFGSGATGTKIHFSGIRLGQLAGVKLDHVGYTNAGAALTDVAGGNVPAYIGSVPTVIPFQQRVRVLATMGSRRSRFLPAVPTLSELGFRELAFDEGTGLYLPQGTPDAVVARLYEGMVAAMQAPGVADTLATAGIEVSLGTGAQLAANIRTESDFWGKIVKDIGFKQDT